MFRSFWKIMPILTLGLGAGLEAQSTNAPKHGKNQTYQSAKECGLHEGECCLARDCKCTMGGAFEFDFLYWSAQNPGFTAYAFEQKDVNAAGTSNDIGSLVRLNSAWDPGFRFGSGWNTNFDRWDVFVDWTWYKNHTDESKNLGLSSSSVVGYYPVTWFHTTEFFNAVSSSWRMLHNAIDIELGRAYYITKALSLRPHWGFRSAWIHQKSHTHFSENLSGSYTNIVCNAKNNFSGVGPRAGIHAKWNIANSGWGILGKASTAVLFGKTKAHFKSSTLTTGTNYTTYRDLKDHFSQFVPNLQLFLGIDWGSCLDCEHYYLGINAGWETNIYWNQYSVPMMHPTYSVLQGLPSHSSEAVTMGGLTLNVHFDF